jgi:hypothetical protein
MTRHSVAALLEEVNGRWSHLRKWADDFHDANPQAGAIRDLLRLADAIERERGTTTNDVLTDAGLVVGPDPGAGAAAPESPDKDLNFDGQPHTPNLTVKYA